MLHGSINHVSITVSDLRKAMDFFGPLLEFLGYSVGEIGSSGQGHELAVNVNEANGTAVNVWQAEPDHADHRFEVYEPGLHHVAWNVERHDQVDAAFELVRELGGEILDGPGPVRSDQGAQCLGRRRRREFAGFFQIRDDLLDLLLWRVRQAGQLRQARDVLVDLHLERAGLPVGIAAEPPDTAPSAS